MRFGKEKEMTLAEVRVLIDAIDPQIKELLMKRLDCSYQVVEAKLAAGETTIFRADREAAILERLGADVPEERRAGYLAVVKKIMEASRMYQYGLMYDRLEDPFGPLSEGLEIPADCRRVRVRLSRPNHPNAMSQILSMIGDYGYDMEQMEWISGEAGEEQVTFELQILGDLNEEHMKKLMFQLSKESEDFRILCCS